MRFHLFDRTSSSVHATLSYRHRENESESHMNPSTQTNWLHRITFWVLGTALFLAISLLPNLLLAWFYTGGRVHSIVVPTVIILTGIMWASSRLTTSCTDTPPTLNSIISRITYKATPFYLRCAFYGLCVLIASTSHNAVHANVSLVAGILI